MSELRSAMGAAVAAGAGKGRESKDYWDVVFEQLRQRKLFKLGIVVLALLYGLAIYAPWIASDRPYVLEAIDYKAYAQARRGLLPIALGLSGLLEKTPAAYLEGRMSGSEQSFDEALSAELHAIDTRIATMQSFLSDSLHPRLAQFVQLARRGTDTTRAGERAVAERLGAELVTSAKAIRTDFEARRPGEHDAARDEGGGVELRAFASYPLLESISAFEMFFMLLWAFVLGWPLWNTLVNRVLLGGSRVRVRRWRRLKLVAVLGLAVLGALSWQVLVGGQLTFNVAPYKRALTDGDIVATRAVFPPLAFGFAETHMGELYRPPTWCGGSKISAEGFYVDRAGAEPDEVTGFVEEPAPVDVRFAEPERNAPLRHLMGTDSLGRDLFVRALWGGRVSLSVGLVSSAILMLIGTVLGCLAGYFGGRVDLFISRLIEVVLCFPVFFLILVVVAFVGSSILNIMLVIGALRWTGVARLGRAEFLRLKQADFVVAAKAQGFSAGRIVFRHMLPNAIGPLLVAGTFAVAAGILIESGLSFLGFGIQLPVPSWGSLVNETKAAAYWWIHLFPGLLIFVTVVCYNLVGDAIRDAMDPKLKA